MQLKEAGPLRAVAYARFSSDLQREESIDAQVRAIREFAGANGMALVDTYVDKAYSCLLYTSDAADETYHVYI